MSIEQIALDLSSLPENDISYLNGWVARARFQNFADKTQIAGETTANVGQSPRKSEEGRQSGTKSPDNRENRKD